jgi:GT2 family glycosyltransferase
MNPVLLLTHNNLELTKKCVESVRAQDVPVSIHIYDNNSSDGTQAWLDSQPDIINQSSGVDLKVSEGWNFVLEILFAERGQGEIGWGAEHVLVLNNDTIIPPYFYRELLSYDVPFVTGFEVQTLPEIAVCPWRFPLQPHPDFSAFIIKREAWEKIGPFDERMKIYCGDCDYHVRGHRLGVQMSKATVPYYHERSSTMRLAPPEERDAIAKQAGEDRAVFQSIYGCIPGQPGYEVLFK